MSSHVAAAPDVFRYVDYRVYLREMYAYLKRTKPQFSYRFFARQAGFSSPNFLKLVIDGKRNLTPASIASFARALRQNAAQRDYFSNLVLMNQATSTDERNQHYLRLSRARGYLQVRRIERDQYDYYTTWYAPPIRELIAVEGFREDPAWIAAQLVPAITAAQATRVLKLLERLRLIRRDADGRLVQCAEMISTGPEVKGLAVRNFHRAMIRRAEEALDRFPVDQRHASGLTVSMSAERAARITEKLHELRRMLFELMCEPCEGDIATAVYQLNLQLFPVTQPPRARARQGDAT